MEEWITLVELHPFSLCIRRTTHGGLGKRESLGTLSRDVFWSAVSRLSRFFAQPTRLCAAVLEDLKIELEKVARSERRPIKKGGKLRTVMTYPQAIMSNHRCSPVESSVT